MTPILTGAINELPISQSSSIAIFIKAWKAFLHLTNASHDLDVELQEKSNIVQQILRQQLHSYKQMLYFFLVKKSASINTDIVICF